MTRVAILPVVDDGFAVAYWLRNAALWEAAVDRIVILATGPMAPSIKVDHPKTTLITRSSYLSAGRALETLVALTDERYILFCEDDAYVRRPGVIEELFAVVESGAFDLSGSPREMASQELLHASRERFGSATAGSDSGLGLWPAFLVIRRDVLARTSGKIDSTLWQRGQTVPGLDHVVTGETASDETFVATSWELRKAGARFNLVPQFRVASEATVREYAGSDPPWFHVGSLSSGSGLYAGLARYPVAHALDYPDELARRMSWWRRWARSVPPSDHRTQYEAAIERLREAASISPDTIERWHELYQPYITWPETP